MIVNQAVAFTLHPKKTVKLREEKREPPTAQMKMKRNCIDNWLNRERKNNTINMDATVPF